MAKAKRDLYSLSQRETKTWPSQFMDEYEWNTFISKYGEELARTMRLVPKWECSNWKEIEIKRQKDLEDRYAKFNLPYNQSEINSNAVIKKTPKVLQKKQTKREIALSEANAVEQSLF